MATIKYWIGDNAKIYFNSSKVSSTSTVVPTSILATVGSITVEVQNSTGGFVTLAIPLLLTATGVSS